MMPSRKMISMSPWYRLACGTSVKSAIHPFTSVPLIESSPGFETTTSLSVPGDRAGAVALIDVELMNADEAETPPNCTVEAAVKLPPEIRTLEPPVADPDVGATEETVGCGAGVPLGDGVGVCVRVGVSVGPTEVGVGVAVRVGVDVRVAVGVMVFVGVAVADGSVIVTLSSVEVLSTEALGAVSGIPMKTLVAMLIVSEPTSVQVTPSGEL